jgi:hypothetical protein
VASHGKGIWINYCCNWQGGTNLVSNNFVRIQGSDSDEDEAAVQINNSGGLMVVYNSFIIGTQAGIDNDVLVLPDGPGEPCGNFEVMNNILANFSGGRSINLQRIDDVTQSDHNDLYTEGDTLGYFGDGQALSDLSAWQVLSNLDADSVSADPDFASDTDYHVCAVTLNDAAIPVDNVGIDLDGDPRDGQTPDIGADEFDPSTCHE